jgi:hypothetical protein
MVPLRSRGLAYYWRTNAAVVVGVAVAAAVLAGALAVGESVRASIRDLFLSRIGRTDRVVSSARFFREGLAEELASSGRVTGACPLIGLEGVATHEASGRRASKVSVYGVDDRFFAFHARPDLAAPEGADALLSPALAAELLASPGDVVLARVDPPAEVPAASLFGRRDERGRALRLTARGVRGRADLGEFALTPQQQDVRALFVPLARLQRALGQPGRVNVLLMSDPGAPGEEQGDLLRAHLTLDDLGVRLRALPDRGALSLETDTALLDDALAAAAGAAAAGHGLRAQPVLSYLATAIGSGARSIPYSLVTALDDRALEALGAAGPRDPDALWLNDWTARDLGAGTGDTITLDYLLWEELGRFVERSAEFRLAGVIPLRGAAADRDLVPAFPGITDSLSLARWDPPFPIDLRRIRPRDEEYWARHRATPKAFLPLARGRELFGHRLGRLTSLRLFPEAGADLEAARARYAAVLRAALGPTNRGFTVEPIRARGLLAAQGATDFGEYFAYFSAFLVGAALLLAGLFFRLGVEQRLREVGLLRAVGFDAARLRRLFLGEGLGLAALGSVIGLAGAGVYAGLMLLGLRTIWVGAVGTDELRLHLSVRSLSWGVTGAVASALLVTALTLRGLHGVPPRRLLTGERDDRARTSAREGRVLALASAAVAAAAALLGLTFLGALGETAGFFGAGLLFLGGVLAFEWGWLSKRRRAPLVAPGWTGVLRLGLRGATSRPGRSLLVIALIASACFVIVSVSAFRKTGEEAGGRASGTGGYALVAESLLPLHHDPARAEGRAALGLEPVGEDPLAGAAFARFRLRPGDDASCLNLYRPQSPRILAPAPGFVEEGRFSFRASLASSPEEERNPWRLLERDLGDRVVPVIADATSLAYVLHRQVGEEMALDLGGRPVRLRFVGALRDSLFQGEVLMSEAQFLRLFPADEGYRFFLIDAPPGRAAAVLEFLETRLADLGFDAAAAAERLAAYLRVENTYLATFQALGSLGLVLGTIGLAAVLIRNTLERRRELALLRAVGYRRRHLSCLVVAENLLLVATGLATGALAALLAIAPMHGGTHGGELPMSELAAVLLAVLGVGVLVSVPAVIVLNRMALLASLRAE